MEYAIPPDEKAWAMEFPGDGDEPTEQPDDGILLRLKAFLWGKYHLDPGEDEEDPKQQDDPVDPHEHRPQGYERAAGHEGAEDSVEEDPVLVFWRNGEV